MMFLVMMSSPNDKINSNIAISANCDTKLNSKNSIISFQSHHQLQVALDVDLLKYVSLWCFG